MLPACQVLLGIRKMVVDASKIFVTAPTNLEFEAVEKVVQKYGCKGIVTGVGPVKTSHILTRHVEVERPDIVLLCGVGGLYSNRKDFGPRVFVAETEILADFGRCSKDFISPLEIGGQNIDQSFELSESWQFFTVEELAGAGFTTARMATVSCVSANRERALYISELYNVQVENMEGASAALVCSHYGISLFEFRAISNIAGDIDHSKWKIKSALASLCREVDRFLGLLYT